jgi:hypothetical protein
MLLLSASRPERSLTAASLNLEAAFDLSGPPTLPLLLASAGFIASAGSGV